MCKTSIISKLSKNYSWLNTKSKHICERDIFFVLPRNVIETYCRFKYDFNTSVPFGMLDGGPQIILANIDNKKRSI